MVTGKFICADLIPAKQTLCQKHSHHECWTISYLEI